MFKLFFKRLNLLQGNQEQTTEVVAYSTSYNEIFEAIRPSNATFSSEKLQTEKPGKMSITISEGAEVIEMENHLQIYGSAKALQKIADELQLMEFSDPGDQYFFGEWRFLVTDGQVMSSKDEKFIALPPDEWLMMGCKFNDAISGYDHNPYTYFSSPFGNYTLAYGIEFYVTDLPEE